MLHSINHSPAENIAVCRVALSSPHCHPIRAFQALVPLFFLGIVLPCATPAQT